MLCYKDMTFCQYYMCKNFGKSCVRSLTPEIREGAKRAGLGISIENDVPECFEEKERQAFKGKEGKDIWPTFP